MKIEPLIVIGGAAFGAVQLFRSIRNAKVAPDPWTDEIEKSLHTAEALPVCHRCFAPQLPQSWFCPECGTAVGRYNNLLPYVNIFSQGEVLRAATTQRIRHGFLTFTGFFLISINCYLIFAPIFWYFWFKNFREHSSSEHEDHSNTSDT